MVLENREQRLVGMAVLKRFDTFHEQHIATLSFRVCPSYFEQTSELLTAAAEKAKTLSIQALQIYIADCDDDQKRDGESGGICRRIPFGGSTLRWGKLDGYGGLYLVAA